MRSKRAWKASGRSNGYVGLANCPVGCVLSSSVEGLESFVVSCCSSCILFTSFRHLRNPLKRTVTILFREYRVFVYEGARLH